LSLPATDPDIAIEVVVTSGGLDKLSVYQGLEVSEVWFWMDDVREFRLYALSPGKDGYEPIAPSRLVHGLDFALLTRFATRVVQSQAMKKFREILHAPR
jgi:Uma2 family endonuclease